ncbi:21629_t:CDS:2 [Cetraspora pellucida]|uniref:21629_t:CDS:1 n=1 Tax=Cetraspora pellucida TaxID=1433469 RepID=A0A9N9CKN5_9GLOM|nr:21629_t:CDS:2 [Cetraspora pellucida]
MTTLLGLKSFTPVIANYYVTVFIDNQVARKMMKSRGKRPWQKEIMREVWNFCELHDIRIQEFLWCRVTITLITPVWSSAPWWPILLQQRTKTMDLPPATQSFMPSQCENLPPEP